MEKEIRINKALVPITDEQMNETDVFVALARQIITCHTGDIKKLAERAMLFDMEDARKLGVVKDVNNLQKSATAIAQYFGLIKMLVENMREDLNSIERKRNLFIKEWIRIQNEQI